MNIQPIVEGHGDVAALPVLLRRLQGVAGVYGFGIGRPIRRPASDLRNKDRFQQGIKLALAQEDCAAILVLFDSEDDCPAELGPQLLTWSREVTGSIRCDVVLAHREYETWFLAAIESLRGYCGVRNDAESMANPERRRGAKEALENQMVSGRSYSESTDQPRLSNTFDMKASFARSRSFRKLVLTFGAQVQAIGLPLPEWPPHDWQE